MVIESIKISKVMMIIRMKENQNRKSLNECFIKRKSSVGADISNGIVRDLSMPY